MSSESENAWPAGVVLPLALLGPPLLGLVLIIGLPRTPSANASIPGFYLSVLAWLALVVLVYRKSPPGGWRFLLVCLTLGSAGVSFLFLTFFMMAP
jgi:hypothetical protein